MTRAARPARKPRRPYHHGNLRRGLLDEALSTIRTEGVEALTLREIGARLGVSRTALYRHFADKRALLDAVAIEGFRRLREQLTAAWVGGAASREAFDAMGVAYIQFAIENPSHYRVMFGGFVAAEAAESELATEAAGSFQALIDALTSLQGAGAVRADHPLQMAHFVWAVVHGVAMLVIDGRLHEAGDIEQLTRYTIARLGTGIDSPPRG